MPAGNRKISPPNTRRGFTLAELLISLALLGVIATFTIPKVLQAQQADTYNAKTKEAAAMFVGAYQKAQQDGIVNANTKPADLIPYMNYVALDTSSTIDSVVTYTSRVCNNSNYPCIKLHNGAMVWFEDDAFGGTSALNVIEISIDPDPVNNTTSTADGPLKAVQFDLSYNGRLTTRGQVVAGTMNAGGAFPIAAYDPSWFKW